MYTKYSTASTAAASVREPYPAGSMVGVGQCRTLRQVSEASPLSVPLLCSLSNALDQLKVTGVVSAGPR